MSDQGNVWGQPPGGGAFGPPSGGGGAFGPPGGGGGGAFGPPGGGGGGGGPQGPLSQIPFTPQEESNIRGAGKFMFLAGAVTLLSALLSLAKIGVQLWAAPVLDAKTIGIHACFGIVVMGLAAVFSVLLFGGAKALKTVVDTDTDDQLHLVQAIRKLRTVFMLKAVLILSVIVLACIMGAVAGAMVPGLMR